MKLRIFPSRTVEERKSERKDAVTTAAVFAFISLICLALFFFAGDLPPSSNSAWGTVRWIALIIGAVSTYLTVQSVFEAAVVASIGFERAFAIFAVIGLIGALFAWLS